ncbi:hypothetical protein CEXT_130201 [Caerostris extrusa]|uniref:Ycf15 n=1 Tax=Caerostris extrusa TaxID=172846 RepID=A0AAV4W006_CAEEX|nr:hypothetical protein CEXT_130201 [Caerostris extrusa]
MTSQKKGEQNSSCTIERINDLRYPNVWEEMESESPTLTSLVPSFPGIDLNSSFFLIRRKGALSSFLVNAIHQKKEIHFKIYEMLP